MTVPKWAYAASYITLPALDAQLHGGKKERKEKKESTRGLITNVSGNYSKTQYRNASLPVHACISSFNPIGLSNIGFKIEPPRYESY